MSRIIVKGLSKSTKEGNIREQFSSKGEITDVKIVKTKDGKSRQFAFVGFRTNEQALDAIKHFNNTFLGTAKIIVELAKKIGDAPLNPFKSTKSMKGNKDVVSDEKIETIKETSVMTAREIKQAKEKADFLEAMKPRKNTKFWANDEGDITGTTNLDNNNNNMNNTNDEGDSESVESSESDASETKVDKNNLTSLSALDYLKSKKVTSFSDSEDENEENETDNNRTDEANKDNQTYIDDNDEIDDTGRLFIRNLPFSVTEDELKELFASYGPITEVHLPLDSDRNRKGYGFVQFMLPEHALKAKDTLDGSSFQGRLLHIILAKKPREVDYSAIQNSKLSSFQLKKELNRKKNLNVKDGWNSSYLRSDTVIDAIASQYGVERSDIMDINEGSGEMAIRLAMGEAQIAQENKEYFVSHGVDITALDSVNSTNKSIQRSTTCLLIKNLPHDLVEDELKSMFTKYGPILSFLIPPSKSMALVNYKSLLYLLTQNKEPSEARAAFKGLAYRKYKHVPLYIEWAPLNIIKDMKPGKVSTKIEQVQKNTVTEIVDDQEYGTIYVKNLNFVTTEEDLYNHLQRLNIIKGIRKISIPVNSKQGTGNMSMGYGFIEYNNSAHATQALVKLNESVLHDHSLEAKKSEKRLTSVKKSSNSSISANNSKNNKLVVRNVAFQATSSELKTLFSSYGNVKRVRIPKKMGGEHRGFAFIDFSTNQEAVNAMESLKTTHLYGRHLVIEWAKEDDDNEGLSSSNINNLRKRASIDVKKKNNNNSTIQSKKRKTSDDMVDPDFNFNQSIDDLDEVDDDDDDNDDN